MSFFDIEIIVLAVVFAVMAGSSMTRRNIHMTAGAVVIQKETSTLLKALCCIVIIVHHFALRVDGGAIVKICQIGGGNFSLVVFLLLSAYGIVKSEQRQPLGCKDYTRHRMVRLLRPYAIIMALFITIYWFIGANATPDEMVTARLNPGFIAIGQHNISWTDIAKYFVGISSINGSLWFVGVTVFSYVAFFICKSIFDISAKRLMLTTCYTILLAAFGYTAYRLDFPAHYWRNLWALVAGVLLALYEREIMESGIKKKLALLLSAEILATMYVYLTRSGGMDYIVFANFGVMAIFLSNELFKRMTISQGSYIALMAAISYEVYLIHGYVLPVEWWYTGYFSCAVTVVFCVACAGVYYKLSRKKIL